MLKPLNKWIRRTVLLPLTALSLVATAHAQTVTIGVQSMFAPWKDAIAQKQFEQATGWDIQWRNFDSGGDVMMAMASGDVQIGVAGSSPIAAAVSRGVDAQLFWILDNIADAEALVVRNGSGIVAPQDLAGKTLAVPFVSTTHFHALFALEQFGLTGKVKVINLQPSDIPAAWERGDIDAAFIWDPALGRLKQSGHVLLTSGQLTDWGKATFDGLVVDKQFAAANGPGMQAFTQVLQDSTAVTSRRQNPGPPTRRRSSTWPSSPGPNLKKYHRCWRCTSSRWPANRPARRGWAVALPRHWPPPPSS